jgi:arylsulfatase A-like enzyme
LSCLIDLLPTVAAIHGVPTAADLDGVDLLSPTGRAADRRAFFEGHHEKTVGVRTAREKLVYNLDRRQSLLFDLAADPGETSPLVGAPDDHPLWTALTAYAGREVRGASTAEQAAIHQRLKDLGYVE